MKKTYKCFAWLAILFVVACSNEKERIGEGELPEDNVFKGYVDTLDKAKGVEQTIQDAAQKQFEDFKSREY